MRAKSIIAFILAVVCVFLTLAPSLANGIPYVVQTCFISPAGTSTSQTVTCTTAPTTGNTFIVGVHLHTTAAVTITTPSGTWTNIATCVGQGATLALYSHSITSSDTTANSFAWSWGATAYYSHINMVEVSSASVTVDASVCAAVATGTSPQTITSGSASPTKTFGDLPLFFSAASNSSAAPTAGSASGASSGSCTMLTPGNTGGIYLSTESCPRTAGTTSTSTTETYPTAESGGYETALILVAPSNRILLGLGMSHGGGPHVSLVQTFATPPPPPEIYVYHDAFGENLTTTSAQNTQYLGNALCEGGETTPNGSSIFNCGAGQMQYWSLNMGQPNLSGHDTSMPWAAGETGTGCTEPSGSNFWASTVPNYTDPNVSTNWFVWPNGTTVGTISSTSDIGAAVYPAGATGTSFTLVLPFINLGSSTMLSYALNTFQNCGDHNSYKYAREDNATFGNESLEFTSFGAHIPPAYNQLKNFGSESGGPPYASTNCNGGGNLAFNGTRCTRTTQLTSVDTSTQTFPTDASYKAAYCTAFNTFHHKDNSPLKFMINNAFSTDTYVLGCTNTFATQAEKYIVGGCSSGDVISGTGNNIINPCLAGLFGHKTSFSADNVATVINFCSATVADDPGKQNMVEDYAPVPLGSALSQWNFRAHWGALWACEYDQYPNMMISFAYFGNNVSGDMATYSPDYIEPFSRITPFPRRAQAAGSVNECSANSFANDMGTGNLCTVNGIRDPNICLTATGSAGGSSNSCVVVTEFNHIYNQATPDLTKWPGSPVYTGTSTLSDLGKGCEIYNNTASGVQITSTVLAAMCPNTNTVLTKVLAFCTPSGYFNTSGSGLIYNMPSSGQGAVCSGTSGSSVNQGGAWDHSQSLTGILNEYLAPGDMLFATQN